MKALTICQPWASAILLCGKSVENRTWTTNHRGPMLVHAGKNRSFLEPARICENYRLTKMIEPFDALPFGAIIGIVELSGCVRLNADLIRSNPWANGPYCWKVDRPRLFGKPIPCAGARMLWDEQEVCKEVMGEVAWEALLNTLDPGRVPKKVEIKELSLFQ